MKIAQINILRRYIREYEETAKADATKDSRNALVVQPDSAIKKME